MLITTELQESDELVITATSTNEKRYIDFNCVVATVGKDCIKVWNKNDVDPQLTKHEIRNGKFWFNVKDIEKIKLVARYN